MVIGGDFVQAGDHRQGGFMNEMLAEMATLPRTVSKGKI